MIKEEIYDELDFLKFGDMLLLNPRNEFDQPCFFIKEKDIKIKELINSNYMQYEIRYFTLGRVTAYLLLFIFDEENENIYGEWINIYNKTDKINFIEINFKNDIHIAIIDEKNQIKKMYAYDNPFKNKIGEIFKKRVGKPIWSQKEFEMEVSIFNQYESKKSFYEDLLKNI